MWLEKWKKKKKHVEFLTRCLPELSFQAVSVISSLTALQQSALIPRGSPTWGCSRGQKLVWWPHLASTEAIQGVSQVPGWRPLPPKILVSQVVAAARWATGIWQVRKQGVMLLRLLAGAPASGSGDADCLSALAPWEAHLPNPVLLKK